MYQYFLGLVSILLLDGFARCCLYKIAGDPEISLRLYVTTTGSAHSLCFPPNRSCHRLETKPFLKNHQRTLFLPSHCLHINRRKVCREGIRKKVDQREKFGSGDHCLDFAGVTTLISDAFELRMGNLSQFPICCQLTGMRRNVNAITYGLFMGLKDKKQIRERQQKLKGLELH